MSLIHLFRHCNQRCVFCSYPSEQRGKDEKAGLKLWIKEISGMSPGLVQISGGEPLLAGPGDLLKLLAFCARTGRRVEFQTNAALFPAFKENDRRLLVRAVAAAGGYFNINFPSYNAASDLRITRTRGAFAARLKAVRQMLALGAEVRLTYVLSAFNHKDAAKFAAFAARAFRDRVRVQFSYIKGVGRAEGSELIPGYREAAPNLLKALDLCAKKGVKFEVDHIPPCFLGDHWNTNVDIAKMRAAAKGPHLTEKKKVPQCRGCRFFRRCPGPRKDYIAVHGRL